MSFILNAPSGSIQAELVRLFNVIDDSYLSTKSVSTTAFCKARMKLTVLELYELLINKISKNLNVIRSNRKFVRKDRRFTPNEYPMSYKRMC